jgi:hypothetical protein
MKITFLLSLILLFAACGPGPTVTIEVCAISGLLPGLWCLSKIFRKFEKGQEPTAHCNVCHEPTVKVCDETGKRAGVNCPAHEVPESEAPAFYCRRHARNPLASPWLVLAWLDAQSKWQRYTPEEKDWFCQRVGGAGVRYIRIFFPGWDDLHPAGSVFPYLQEADGRWNLDKPNPAYDENLRRIARHLSKYEVGLYIDMADQCGWSEYWDCWRRNINGVQGWMDTSLTALAYWKAAVDRILAAIGGAEGNIIGLGNELRRPDDDDVTLEWALAWAGPRVDYLVSLGIAKPITISGGSRTVHKIMGTISDEDGNYPDNSFVCLVNHGVGLVDHVPPGFDSLDAWLHDHSEVRLFGYSDDGTDTNPWCYIPPEKAGTYDKSGGKCASVAEKIKLMKLFLQYFNEGQLRVIEFLPREISFDEGPDSLAEQSLEAFWRVGLEALGVDPRRTF